MRDQIIYLDPTAAGLKLTPDEVERLAIGEARLVTKWLAGGQVPRLLKLSPKERQEFEDCKRRGWYLTKTDKSKVERLAYLWLEAQSQPIVYVRPNRLYARVTMDLISVPRAESDHMQRISHQNPPAVIGGRTEFMGMYSVVGQVPRDNGPKCAEWLIDLWRSGLADR